MAAFDPELIRGDFPILQKLIYLDNAATSLSPRQVVEAQNDAEYNYRANVGRGIHRLSRIATHQYLEAHEILKRFFGGENGTLAFTKNTTEAINTVSLGLRWNKTDRIVTTIQDHHSNLLPWYRLYNEGRVAGVDVARGLSGVILPEDVEACITKDTRLVAIGHASNVFGTITEAEEIAKICKDYGVLLLLDGAQTAPHLPLNLEKLACDFFCFSGHKMLGPMGTGGLWISPDVAEPDIPAPLFAGGGMVAQVDGTSFTCVEGHARFEAGTQNVIGAVGLAEAARYLMRLGMENVASHSAALARRMISGLSEIPGVHIYTPSGVPLIGTVSFTLEGVHPHEVAYLLDEAAGIMVRSGEHCCQPLMKGLGLAGGTVRASAYCYNSEDDIDMLTATVEEIAGMVK
ncbi:cysteine desulfurase [Methanorbis rubei]|uniref:cysteine desulfurase n=1 Tax=Methanorbis rubei TaxID=3028300 RepID=A0AAE4SDI6_9EURY|nr:putative cysteine desulfurase [Methanocorpusculaceae archaeon Cs1]